MEGSWKPIDLVLEFLFVAVQVVLFIEGVYPADLFERNRKFGIAVSVCRHPDVCSYVRDHLTEARKWFEEGKVEKFVIPILERSRGSVMRNYVFLLRGIRSPTRKLNETQVKDLEVHLRGALARLMNLRRSTPPLDTVTWDMVMFTSGVPLGQSWAAAAGTETREIDPARKSLQAIKDVDTGSIVALEVYLEESKTPEDVNVVL
ncbi:hypothetical protein NDN08_004360 [Rhodosorus marinus]|uniref:HORMA domain-containing protein n=1 Tax=Rhodosorus marinus TaxID=101924 RepID=A0AAV8URN1_9RHOD|nr:hypothetical protein NDN08_004360 [Rhodosorus marinus]